MAGLGQRFRSKGYSVPKPLLPVGNFRMFEIVMSNFYSPNLSQITLVAPASFQLQNYLSEIQFVFPCELHLIEIDYLTDGPASTCFLATERQLPELPLVIANSDQFLDFEMEDWMKSIELASPPGSILTMEDIDPKWSFVRLFADGTVAQVSEKKVISNRATCGVYFFESPSLFNFGFQIQREKNERVNGEFYVGPIYNHLIANRQVVTNFHLGQLNEVMFGMGTPEDYEHFITNPIRKRAEELGAKLFRQDLR